MKKVMMLALSCVGIHSFASNLELGLAAVGSGIISAYYYFDVNPSIDNSIWEKEALDKDFLNFYQQEASKCLTFQKYLSGGKVVKSGTLDNAYENFKGTYNYFKLDLDFKYRHYFFPMLDEYIYKDPDDDQFKSKISSSYTLHGPHYNKFDTKNIKIIKDNKELMRCLKGFIQCGSALYLKSLVEYKNEKESNLYK